MAGTLFLLPLFTLFFAFLQSASGQITASATCLADAPNFNNSRGQDPCTVYAYLGGACSTGIFTVGPLPAGFIYTAPDSPTPCQCSTVAYSMMSACSMCQGANFTQWSVWSKNCNSTSLSTYPVNILSGTSVPGWAYEDVTTLDEFDPQKALADTSPESSATSAPPASSSSSAGGTNSTTGSIPATTSTGSTSKGGSTSTSAETSATAAPSSNSDSGKEVTRVVGVGAIVGIAVGAACLLGLFAFLFIRYRKRSGGNTRSSQLNSYDLEKWDGSKYDILAGRITPLDLNASPMRKPYDPNDPSTFPYSPTPVKIFGHYQNHTLSPPRVAQKMGSYRGVAEL